MSFTTEVGSLKTIDPKSMDNNPSLTHNNCDNDGDLPYFSDIEALVYFIIQLFMFTSTFKIVYSLLILDLSFQILQLDLEFAQGSCITSEGNKPRVSYDL